MEAWTKSAIKVKYMADVWIFDIPSGGCSHRGSLQINGNKRFDVTDPRDRVIHFEPRLPFASRNSKATVTSAHWLCIQYL